ncbi:hypothetical protein Aple_073690 [Acrocarpospora pleiomorpha]|uniref:Tetratrico peptide repeat group 5 domain-containing protein n=1 Tax=Acrocarpospora pleiomorpha TaxID=90975 RepID=A0A5M3XUB1_9ACTN|nr:tetratricopeptide repeat protein [Acrocarpospora pleiomorpha]GES24470.1 hypothetical protein Aple_073690 [Acrocarpospora pleiomorpha]
MTTAGCMITLNNMAEVELPVEPLWFGAATSGAERSAGSGMSRQHQATRMANSGNLRQHLGEHSSALDFYRKTLQIYDELGDRRSKSEILTETGFCYLRMNRGSDALIHC